MLVADNLTKRFSDELLFESVTMKLRRGELKILFGASGIGKTTLVKILARLEKPDSGEVTLDSIPSDDITPEEWRRKVVMVHQTPCVFPGTVKQNFSFIANYHNISVDYNNITDPLLLSEKLEREASELSGGEQKRLALGRAIAVQPDFLLLDEPTVSIDEPLIESIDELILDLAKNQDIGILVVTHNTDEVRRLGQQGYHLKNQTFHNLSLAEKESETV